MPIIAKRPLISSASAENMALPRLGTPLRTGIAVARVMMKKVRTIGIVADSHCWRTFWPENLSAAMAATTASIASRQLATSGMAPEASIEAVSVAACVSQDQMSGQSHLGWQQLGSLRRTPATAFRKARLPTSEAHGICYANLSPQELLVRVEPVTLELLIEHILAPLAVSHWLRVSIWDRIPHCIAYVSMMLLHAHKYPADNLSAPGQQVCSCGTSTDRLVPGASIFCAQAAYQQASWTATSLGRLRPARSLSRAAGTV